MADVDAEFSKIIATVDKFFVLSTTLKQNVSPLNVLKTEHIQGRKKIPLGQKQGKRNAGSYFYYNSP